MVDNVRRECIMSMYEIYPLSRKLVFDTFDFSTHSNYNIRLSFVNSRNISIFDFVKSFF